MRLHIWAVAVVLVAVTAGTATGDARAAAPAEWRALQADIAAPYPSLATPEGRTPDYLAPGVRPVPVPMMGFALIQAGIANDQPAQVDSGLRTIDDYIENGPLDGPPGVFVHFAIASAYNLLRDKQPGNPLFSRHRERWEEWLRHCDMKWLPRTDHYANKYMVEVIAVLELGRSGVTSTATEAVLGQGDRPQQMALNVLDGVAPTVGRASGTTVAGAPAMVLSDPSNNALAYHALTLGFLARAIDMLGPNASSRARDALQRVARASWAAMGPDGDVAYIGRSQEQGWALSMTAYGAEVAADDADSTWAPRFHAVADRAMARLRAVHGVGPGGLWITPSAGGAVGAGRRGLDTYANGPGYGALALVGVNWAVEHAESRDRRSDALAADSPGDWQLAHGHTEFHTVRTPGSWFAVKSSRSSVAKDLRYDFGLVALKRPGPDGSWVDVVRPRPHTTGRPDSAGPVLIGAGKARALPDGMGSRVSGGVVTVRGGYRTGHRWVGRGETFRYAPVGCGVRATFTRRRGGALEYSVFFRGRPRARGQALTDGTTVVQATPRPAVTLRSGYSSGVDARLIRAVLRFRPGRTPVRVTTCGA